MFTRHASRKRGLVSLLSDLLPTFPRACLPRDTQWYPAPPCPSRDYRPVNSPKQTKRLYHQPRHALTSCLPPAACLYTSYLDSTVCPFLWVHLSSPPDIKSPSTSAQLSDFSLSHLVNLLLLPLLTPSSLDSLLLRSEGKKKSANFPPVRHLVKMSQRHRGRGQHLAPSMNMGGEGDTPPSQSSRSGSVSGPRSGAASGPQGNWPTPMGFDPAKPVGKNLNAPNIPRNLEVPPEAYHEVSSWTPIFCSWKQRSTNISAQSGKETLYPRRPGYNASGDNAGVMVNQFRFTALPQGDVFQYRVRQLNLAAKGCGWLTPSRWTSTRLLSRPDSSGRCGNSPGSRISWPSATREASSMTVNTWHGTIFHLSVPRIFKSLM